MSETDAALVTLLPPPSGDTNRVPSSFWINCSPLPPRRSRIVAPLLPVLIVSLITGPAERTQNEIVPVVESRLVPPSTAM